jgi:hypothetical protein
MTAQAGPLPGEALAARTSRVGMPKRGTPREKASPLAAATPIRRPVKEPGPTDTLTAVRSFTVTDAAFRSVPTEGRSLSEWERGLVSDNSPRTAPLEQRATLPRGVAVSIPRTAPEGLLFF